VVVKFKDGKGVERCLHNTVDPIGSSPLTTARIVWQEFGAPKDAFVSVDRVALVAEYVVEGGAFRQTYDEKNHKPYRPRAPRRPKSKR
jgi:hypothetical protein